MSYRILTFASLLARRCTARSGPYYLFGRRFSLTPEFKSRFYFPLERLDQILDGTYPRHTGWMSKWKAYLAQFHKLRIDQIKDMLHVCAKRRVVPLDLWNKLRSMHWTAKLSDATGTDLASVLHSLALLNQSRQLNRGRILSEPFTQAVLKQAMQRTDLGAFKSKALSECIYAFALLGLNGHPIVALYSETLAKIGHKGLNTHALANVLWSWAKLNYSDAAVIAALSTEVLRKKQLASGQELSTVLWSWGSLKYPSKPHWEALIEEIHSRKKSLSAPQLSRVFAACVHGNCQFLTFKILPLLEHTTAARKQVFLSMFVLTSLIWSLGQLRASLTQPAVMALVMEAMKESRLERATCQELCCLTIGLSLMDYRDAADCANLHSQIMKPSLLSAFNAQELCNLIWALGKMSVKGMHCQKSLAAELVGRKEAFDQFSCQGLTSVMVGWAHCSFSEKDYSNTVLREVMKQERLRSYNPQELANLCWSFGRLNIHSVNLYAKLTEHILKEPTLNALSSQGLISVLVGWAHGRFSDPPAIDCIVQQLSKDKISELRSQELASLCWALGKLQYSGPVVMSLAEEASQSQRLRSFTPLQLSIVLLGWSKSEMHDLKLWDRLVAEFTSREDTLAVDLSVLHNFTLAVQKLGFKSVISYRTRRMRGRNDVTCGS